MSKVEKWKNCIFTGSMYQFDLDTAISITTKGVYEIIPDMIETFTDGVVFQNTQELKIVSPGWYDVNWDISFIGSANVEVFGAALKNGVAITQLQSIQKPVTAIDIDHLSAHQHVELVKDDLIQLGIANNTSTTNFVITGAHLELTFVRNS